MFSKPANGRRKVMKVHRINRLRIGFGVLLQIVLLLLIVVLVNYIGFNNYKRWDLSQNQKYTLSDQTRQLLKSLKKPLKIVVFFSPGSPLAGEVDALIKECQYLGRKNIEFESVDPYRNFTRARELQAQYKFGSKENVLIVDYNGRTKFVTDSEMAEFDNSGAVYGEAPRLVSFRGEQALVGALLTLSEEKQGKVLFLTGHGEAEPEALATFSTYVARQNLKVEVFNLASAEAPPADVQAAFVIGPKYDFGERDLLLLQSFWEKKGRLFLMLDPAAATPKLHRFLGQLGVYPNADRVLTTVTLKAGLAGILKEPAGEFVPQSGPITKRFKGVNTNFLGITQSLKLDAERVRSANVKLQPLVQAVKGFWGETEYAAAEQDGVYFDPTKDHGAPLVLAASIEQGGVDDARVQVDSSRMVVVGNAQFLNNEALTQANLDFALSALNWLVDREELIGIAPKVPKTFTLNLSQDQISNLALLTMLAIPGAAFLAGVIAWLKRRR